MKHNTSELFDKVNERYDWCLKYFGTAQDYPPRWEPIGIGNPKFKFRDERDRIMFILRWGE